MDRTLPRLLFVAYALVAAGGLGMALLGAEAWVAALLGWVGAPLLVVALGSLPAFQRTEAVGSPGFNSPADEAELAAWDHDLAEEEGADVSTQRNLLRLSR
ncbi:MAG: hypothetical protein ACFBRM_03690 [Pikeienuella sp.]